MTYKNRKWCPNGCGKTVRRNLHISVNRIKISKKAYYCSKCNTYFL